MPELPEVPRFFAACPRERVSLGDQSAVRIGHDGLGYEILVLGCGRVVGHRYDDVDLFNSSLEQYRQSLLLIEAALADPSHLDDEQNYRVLEHALRRVDPIAWDTPGGCYWTGIMEEISYQFPYRIEPPPGA